MKVEFDKRRKVTIIHEASYITFCDDFKGLFAVAVRDRQFSLFKADKSIFALYYGNSHNYSEGDYDAEKKYVEKKINEMENKYIKKEVSFDEKKVDCDIKFYQSMKVYFRDTDEEIVIE